MTYPDERATLTIEICDLEKLDVLFERYALSPAAAPEWRVALVAVREHLARCRARRTQIDLALLQDAPAELTALDNLTMPARTIH